METSASGPSMEAAPETIVRHLGPGEERRPALTLRSAEFRKGREEAWLKLENMVGRIEKKGIAVLSAEEAQELPLLYRGAMSSLSVARNIVLDRNLLLYLEDLSLRAYLAVYGPRAGMGQRLGEFFSRGFPQAVRGMGKHMAVAAAALLIGVLVGYLMVRADLAYFNLFVPEWLAGGRGPDSSAEDLLKEELFAPWPGFVETFVVFANSLFRHNSIIGIMAFGLGFALGIPTILLLIYNGLGIGAFIALHVDRGLGLDFIGWLSIHGVTEILALIISAGAGLVLAEKILFPGALPRLESLARYGRLAAGAAAGAVGLDFIAGLLEGGFRQLIANTPGRYGVALLTLIFWSWYFLRVGRDGSDGQRD